MQPSFLQMQTRSYDLPMNFREIAHDRTEPHLLQKIPRDGV